jgi:hypothetical protein
MTLRRASCNCGQLQVDCEGEPVRVSMCHCVECQRRTGAVLSNQARFNRSQISVEGRSTRYVRVGDSGKGVAFQFCPVCGSTVYWELEGFPDVLAVAVGAFADPAFPAPQHSVYQRSKHHWVKLPADLPIHHED